MSVDKKYRLAFLSCCMGSVLQSFVVNIAPVLFIPLKMIYGFSYAQLGVLVAANYITQLICDFTLGSPADKYGVKKFFIASPIFIFSGFMLFSLAPVLFPDSPYTGFFISTIIFSIGGGLLELLVSPIVNALPVEDKVSAMSAVHGCFAWGQVGVVLITTVFLGVFGKESWHFVYAFWSILAVVLVFMIKKSNIVPPKKDEGEKSVIKMFLNPAFILAFVIMIGSGASELAISQWASSFFERGLGLPKEIGDILGMCGFAVMMGVGRTAFSKVKLKMKVIDVLICGALLSVICYLLISLTKSPVIAILACAFCGLGISLLWPCTLTLSAERFPLGGTFMFAVLAGGGDVGCSLGSGLLGVVTDAVNGTAVCDFFCRFLSIAPEQASLRIGVLFGASFPLITLTGLLLFKKIKKKNS